MVKDRKRGSRRLRVVEKAPPGLGLDTIMDRTLAAQHGAAYVHLAAFAIDVDRVRAFHAAADTGARIDDDADPDAETLPFGWEAFLTEVWLLEHFDLDAPAHHALVEDVCLSILDDPPDQPRFGDQIPFALYDAVERGAAPEALRSVFHHWRQKPKELLKDLGRLWSDADHQIPRLARVCLDTPLSPPAAPPTLAAWEAMESRAQS